MPDEEVDPAIIKDGYRIRRKPTSLEPLYLDFIAQFLAASTHTYCVFEDALRQPSDPFLNTRRSEPYMFHAGDVFYVVGHGTATRERIETGLRVTSSAWVQTCLLTETPAGFGTMLAQGELTVQQLSALVEGVRAILVSAFDGVGYIVWEPLS